MLTEDEAKSKRCCGPKGCGELALGTADHAAGVRFCIASICMAWRKVDQVGIGPNGEKRERDLDGRTKWVDRGYCGLAGAVAR